MGYQEISATHQIKPILSRFGSWPVVQAFNYLVLAIFGVCICTYIFTTCRFYLSSKKNRQFRGNEPPTLAYWLPWVGNGIQMIRDPHKFYEETLAKRPTKGPVTMRLGPISMYLVMGASNIQAIFRQSSSLSFEFMQLRIAHKVKGLPASDAALLGMDDSGAGTLNQSETGVAGKGRIWHILHGIYLKNLTEKSAVDFLTAKFVFEFSEQLKTCPEGASAPAVVGLYDFLQTYQFAASTITLVGPRILQKGSLEAKTFWDYDAAFMTLMQGLPKLVCRKGWAARDRTLEATKDWLAAATAGCPRDSDADWEENFGHRLVRERNAALVDYGISFEGRAAMHMGLIWAINANAVPMTAYMLFEMVRDPQLLSRIRAEVKTAMVVGTNTASVLDIDITKLAALPLLNSVYNECLRLRSSIPISRRLRQDIEIDGYTLKKDNFILAPSWLSHIDEAVWAFPGHPARDFWAERFLQPEMRKVKLGDYCPYGGGGVICPGRFFAKHEILAAVAMMVTTFDMEFVRWSHLDGSPADRGPGMEGAECRGVVSLDRDAMVKMQKRKLV
ncbi:cytochrome P450 [Colletotrichum phormii]|uniref:Cytochrome P450 n=1 Tax=Colletotrichum phormii TaxID=359342 RepID=A0AAI9ZRQ9_9PEZI|nr:cytochrome P450 [Colletotrichum phormii]KAK1635793.1 cytochrome P450 [Colletotrichum phormii]